MCSKSLSEMKSRERVIRAIHFGCPDRVPISHGILPAAQIHHGEALNEILEEVHEDFGWDCLPDLKREDFPHSTKVDRTTTSSKHYESSSGRRK